MNYYRTVKAFENKIPDNIPLYDSSRGMGRGRSENIKNAAPDGNSILLRDMELSEALYTQLNAMLMPFVRQAADEYDYSASPIYDEDGISREMLALLTDKVLDAAAEQLDEVDEIRLEVNARAVVVGWDRNRLLRSVAEALILNHIFMYRRPRRRMIYSSYSFKNGEYNGLS